MSHDEDLARQLQQEEVGQSCDAAVAQALQDEDTQIQHALDSFLAAAAQEQPLQNIDMSDLAVAICLQNEMNEEQLSSDQIMASMLQEEHNKMPEDGDLALVYQLQNEEEVKVAEDDLSKATELARNMQIADDETFAASQLQEDFLAEEAASLELAQRIQDDFTQTQAESPEETQAEEEPEDEQEDYEEMTELAADMGDAEDAGMADGQLSALPISNYIITEGDTEPTCGVCKDELKTGDNVKTLPCCHRYHPNCIDEWLKIKATCPICNHNVKEDLANATT